MINLFSFEEIENQDKMKYRNLRSACCLILFCCHFAILFAQRIDGRVTDAQGVGLPYVNISILTLPDSAFVVGTTTGEDGHFRLDIPVGNHTVKITGLGYAAQYRACTPQDLARIVLQDADSQLGEAVVRAERPKVLVKGEGLKTIVAGSVLEKNATIERLLECIPNVSVQGDKVVVFGRGEALIYINGRKMRDKSELDRLTPDNIKDVETILNPGARYPAATKAVVRITTKKPLGEGWAVDARLHADVNEKGSWSEWARVGLNYRKKRLDLNWYMDANNNHSDYEKWFELNSYLAHFWQQTITAAGHSHGKRFYTNLSAAYQIAPDHSIGGRLNFSPERLPMSFLINSQLRRDGALVETGINRFEQGAGDHERSWGSNLYYVGKIGPLMIDWSGDWWQKNQLETIKNQEEFTPAGGVMQQKQVKTQTKTDNKLLASKLVLTAPVWEGSLSVGGEYSGTRRSADYTILPVGMIPESHNQFKEYYTSAFAEYGRSFGPLDVNLGLRYEHVDFNYYNAGVRVAEQSRIYNNLFPSITLSMPFGKLQTQLSYGADIDRPLYDMLKSGIQYDNRYTYETGNPFLLPSISRNLSLTLSYKWLLFNAIYLHLIDPFLFLTQSYNNNPEIMLHRPENGPNFDRLFLSATLQPVVGIWHPQFRATVTKQWFNMPTPFDVGLYRAQATLRIDNAFDTKWGYWRLSTTLSTTGNENNNYSYKPYFCTSLSWYKSFLKDRLSIECYLYDLFSSGDNYGKNYSGALYAEKLHLYSMRNFSITLRYKFNTSASKYKGSSAGSAQRNRM